MKRNVLGVNLSFGSSRLALFAAVVFALLLFPGLSAAQCPPGYADGGNHCSRGADSFLNSPRLADCPAGYENAWTKCYRGDDSITNAGRWADCPAGYENWGASCYRHPHSIENLGRVADCPVGYENTGLTCHRWWPPHSLGLESMTCQPWEFRSVGRCYNHCPQGYEFTGSSCLRNADSLSMESMTCSPGEFRSGGRCYNHCPAGYGFTGTTCYRPVSELGTGSMTCSPGEYRIEGLCHKPCPIFYRLNGEFCERPASTLPKNEAVSWIAPPAVAKEPAYVIAHMANTSTAVDWAIGQGANAVEVDLRFDQNGRPSIFQHGAPCDCSTCAVDLFGNTHMCQPLGNLLSACNAAADPAAHLRHIARTKLALLYIDSRVDAGTSPNAGPEIINLLESALFEAGFGGIAIVSTPGNDSPGTFTSPHAEYLQAAAARAELSPYRDRIHFGFDSVMDAQGAIDNLQELPTRNLFYGIGTSSCLPYTYYYETTAAVRRQAAGALEMTSIWTVDKAVDIDSYLHLGARGFITNRPSVAAAVLAHRQIPLAVPVNVALGKKAYQSNTGYGGDASRAVDGNANGSWSANSVTHTPQENNPWWQLDLAKDIPIDKVVVYNRTDCCGERLSGFALHVFRTDGTLASSYQHYGTPGARTEIPVGAFGRFVKITLPGLGRYLSLAEVQVYPSVSEAIGKPASQSTSNHGGTADRAVDGNTSGNWGDGSVTHTAQQTDPWWKVDLGAVRPIETVVVHNRMDCCRERLDGFILEVLGDDETVVFSYTHGVATQSRIAVDVDDLGRFVRIRLPGTGRILSLAEVEVYTSTVAVE